MSYGTCTHTNRSRRTIGRAVLISIQYYRRLELAAERAGIHRRADPVELYRVLDVLAPPQLRRAHEPERHVHALGAGVGDRRCGEPSRRCGDYLVF